MPDWEERITGETEPALRVEHELRYRLAKPIVAHAKTWCDLGCGNGVAAADALGDALPERVVLVDVDEAVVATARDTLRAAQDAQGVVADLTDAGDLERVRAALTEGGGERVITCFEVVEHLETFVPLVQMLVELASAGEATVVLSVPNDAFWAIENPHHHTMWGEGAFEELRGLLGDDHVIARQVSLRGSAIALGDQSANYEPGVRLGDDDRVPTHLLAALGPRRNELAGGAAVVAVDLDEQRRWERQRDADLSFLRALQAQVDELRAFNELAVSEREDWRRYIHELEDRLGLPRSGTPEASRDALPSG
jgi:SAM-dependent methyltransferase